jgi:putative ABC transport system ATP-binding protein
MIEMKNIKKTYETGSVSFDALKGINLDVDSNEFIAIVGPSGSGKSTLMNLMGCLDTPTGGEYKLEGKQVETLSSNQLAEIRNRQVGFVFQAFNLLPYATAYENVELPILYTGLRFKDRKKRVCELLSRVGLADKMANRPTEMSGGEMQRTAIARALANNPRLILADEPTGNLDTGSGAEIINIFDELWRDGRTVIIITHDANIAKRCQRLIRLKDGLIDTDNGNGNGNRQQSV